MHFCWANSEEEGGGRDVVSRKLPSTFHTTHIAHNKSHATHHTSIGIRGGNKGALHGSQLFWASFIVCGGSVINGAYPVKFLPLGRDSVSISYLTDPV